MQPVSKGPKKINSVQLFGRHSSSTQTQKTSVGRAVLFYFSDTPLFAHNCPTTLPAFGAVPDLV